MSYTASSKSRNAASAVDVLLFRVLAHPHLSELLDRMVGRPEVAAAGFRICERRLSPRPNEERDAEWTRLHDGGLTYTEIAHAAIKSRDTVAKAVQRYRRRRDTESMSTPDAA